MRTRLNRIQENEARREPCRPTPAGPTAKPPLEREQAPSPAPNPVPLRGFRGLATCDLPAPRRRGVERFSKHSQVGSEVRSALVTIFTLFRERLLNDTLQLQGNARPQGRQRVGFLVDDGVNERLRVFAVKGELAADHFMQHNAKRPKVSAVVYLFSADPARADI